MYKNSQLDIILVDVGLKYNSRLYDCKLKSSRARNRLLPYSFIYCIKLKIPRKYLGFHLRGLPNDFGTLEWARSYEKPEVVLGKVRKLLYIVRGEKNTID